MFIFNMLSCVLSAFSYIILNSSVKIIFIFLPFIDKLSKFIVTVSPSILRLLSTLKFKSLVLTFVV
jgi:hypothetical protein